jgi:hypothetical protein
MKWTSIMRCTNSTRRNHTNRKIRRTEEYRTKWRHRAKRAPQKTPKILHSIVTVLMLAGLPRTRVYLEYGTTGNCWVDVSLNVSLNASGWEKRKLGKLCTNKCSSTLEVEEITTNHFKSGNLNRLAEWGGSTSN